jgi:hypothetical protein
VKVVLGDGSSSDGSSSGSSTYQARLVGTDALHDLAVLEVGNVLHEGCRAKGSSPVLCCNSHALDHASCASLVEVLRVLPNGIT